MNITHSQSGIIKALTTSINSLIKELGVYEGYGFFEFYQPVGLIHYTYCLTDGDCPNYYKTQDASEIISILRDELDELKSI